MSTPAAHAPHAARTMSLVEVAERLRNPRVDRVVAGYREIQVSVKRSVLLLIICMWSLFWRQGAIPRPADGGYNLPLGKVLPIEAVQVIPWVLTFLVVSVVWMVLLRTGRLRQTGWTDVAGAVANFVGIWVMLMLAWNLTIATITLLPLSSIIIGARFRRSAFVASMIASVVIVGVAAPPNYWTTRPAFGVFALVLLVGLPLTVNRLLSALYEVSAAAVTSRDAQNRFIATMSHELRTPLNTVIHAASLIDASVLSRDDRELLRSLGHAGSALLHRVNDVLDVAAIDGGRLYIVTAPFRMANVIDAVRTVAEHQAGAAGVALTVRAEAIGGDSYVSDEGRIEQVLTNLVSNAIKFTPDGGKVELAVVRRAVGTNIDEVVFRVSDTGIGISADDKNKVFEAFHQVSGGASRQHGGVGLGLHIVRTVSERLGGKIAIHDNTGGGTVFEWSVRLQRASDLDAVARHENPSDALERHRHSVPSLRCLVVDDNAANRDIVGRILKRGGHSVDYASEGPAGLSALRTQRFDVAFIDLHMPGMSGWDLLNHLQQTPPVNADCRLVVLSAVTDPESMSEAAKRGAAAYLTKPIGMARLLEVLAAVGENRRIDLQDNDADEESPLEVMRSLSSADDVRRFLTSSRNGLVSLSNALSTAWADRDNKRTLEVLHSLKNEFATLADAAGTAACVEVAHRISKGEATPPIEPLQQAIAIAVERIDREPEFA